MVEEVAACLKVSAENVITEVEDHATRTVDNIGLPVYPGYVVAMCYLLRTLHIHYNAYQFGNTQDIKIH